MIQVNKIEPHWNYLVALESDLERLSRFIEFDENNFECYSLEIGRLLLSASAEVDVVCRQLCNKVNSNSVAESINQYQDNLTQHIPDLVGFQVILPRFGLTLTPWSNWSTARTPPLWWTAYNKIKHHRDTEYHQGNLKNALNAIAGLFVLSLYLYKERAEEGSLIPNLQILRVTGVHHGGVGNNGYEFSQFYSLPTR